MTALAVLVAASAARADTLREIEARHKIRVGVDLKLPPFGMVDSALLPTGSDVDSARLLADDLGVQLEVVPTSGANRIPFLQTRKVDVVMSSFASTEARRKVVDFSMPYGIVSIICAAPDLVEIKDARDLEGKTVAVTRGSDADAEATKLAGADGRISVVRFADDATLVTAVVSGQQSIMIAAPARMRDADRRGARLVQKFEIRTTGYAVGLRKSDRALLDAVNRWIVKDLADGRLRQVYAKWHEAELPAELPKE